MSKIDFEILIVEDEFVIAKNTSILITNLYPNANIEISDSLDLAKKCINDTPPDLVLLDINLGDNESGIDLAPYLNKKYIPFIYLTAYSDERTLDEAIQKNPLGYMVKPVSKRDLRVNLELAFSKIKKINYFYFKDGKKSVRIKEENILYLKADGNYTEIYSKEKRYVIRNSLKSILKELKGSFVRTHRGFCVNPSFIKEVGEFVVLNNKDKIPLSRKYKKSVSSMFLEKLEKE